MKNKKIWIVVGVIVLLLIIFFWWKSSRDKKLAAQAERDRINQMYAQPTVAGTASGAGSGAAGTLNSLEGVIDSLAGLFNKTPSTSSNTSLLRQFQDQCESIYNTQAQVDACVAQKLATAGV